MDKRILKKIAKEWVAGILFSTGGDSFDKDSLLSQEEQDFVLKEVHKIAWKFADKDIEPTLDIIISKYYTLE